MVCFLLKRFERFEGSERFSSNNSQMSLLHCLCFLCSPKTKRTESEQITEMKWRFELEKTADKSQLQFLLWLQNYKNSTVHEEVGLQLMVVFIID